MFSPIGLNQNGQIEVISGCMFSGKTEALITQIRRAEIARLSFQVFKPIVDTRYSQSEVASHNDSRFPSTSIEKSTDLFDHLDPCTQVIGIDEVQFFDSGIVAVAAKLAEQSKRVILAGLDTDWKGEPFGPMPQLLAIADIIHKQYAICVICGASATRTQRLVAANEQFLLGSTKTYEARCRKHFDPKLSLRLKSSGHKSLDFKDVFNEI